MINSSYSIRQVSKAKETQTEDELPPLVVTQEI